jgi:hypothetical protein
MELIEMIYTDEGAEHSYWFGALLRARTRERSIADGADWEGITRMIKAFRLLLVLIVAKFDG